MEEEMDKDSDLIAMAREEKNANDRLEQREIVIYTLLWSIEDLLFR